MALGQVNLCVFKVWLAQIHTDLKVARCGIIQFEWRRIRRAQRFALHFNGSQRSRRAQSGSGAAAGLRIYLSRAALTKSGAVNDISTRPTYVIVVLPSAATRLSSPALSI